MKRLAIAGIVALAACAPAEARPPDRVSIMVLQPQQVDSLGIVMAWVPGAVGPRQRPIAEFLTRLVSVADTVARGRTTDQADTLWIPFPPLDSTITIRGCVAAVDVALDQGPYVCSANLDITIGALPPSPVDSIVADTLPAIVSLSRLEMAPGDTAVVVGFGLLVMQLTAFDGLNRPVACSQAMFLERADSTIGLVPSGVCTGLVLVPVDSFKVDGAWRTPAEYVVGVQWTLYEPQPAPAGPQRLLDLPALRLQVEEVTN